MKALIIGLELEWRRGTGEKKQFGSPRGRAGESNASKVETWEAARCRSAATSLRSLGLRTANQFSGWASILRPRFLRTPVNELVAS